MADGIIERLLEKCQHLNASDLHISIGSYPIYRINGDLFPDESFGAFNKEKIDLIAGELLTERQKTSLREKLSVDTGYTADNGLRYRINIYHQRGTLALAIRLLGSNFLSFEALHLPEQLHSLSKIKDGLVLITGATGSGKSTTLATVIDEINKSRHCHIITIEDPIEFIHYDKTSLVHQREVGHDVLSFAEAVRSSLREDPDVILVGEMRDTATMRAALQAAETGHLVFSTLHTNDAIGVIDRLVGSFPGDEQDGIRQQLSRVLRAVISQMLVRTAKGDRRVPVCEVLMVDNAVANLIRNHRPEQIKSIMQSGHEYGNQTLEYSLAIHVINKLINEEAAIRLASNANYFRELLGNLKRQEQNKYIISGSR